jgi:zinc/manganese transport system substrate-binding protein
VTELLSDPNADPHEHEATIYDATRVHGASLVIVNGAGYDTWLQQLVTTSARPSINVAALVGVRTGANPHLFYSLEVAQRVVDAIASRIAISPTQVRLVTTQITALQARVATLRHECAGVEVAATEDVTGYLLGDLGLHVVTPESFRLAIGNGVDPSISAEATAMSTLTKKVAFLVNNVQTATPLTAQLVRSADSLHVPVLNVTETMRGENYVTWMNGVINDVTTALHHEGCAR